MNGADLPLWIPLGGLSEDAIIDVVGSLYRYVWVSRGWHSVTATLERVPANAPVVPARARVLLSRRYRHRDLVCELGSGAVAHVTTGPTLLVSVAAPSPDLAEAELAYWRALSEPEPVPDGTSIPVRILTRMTGWTHGSEVRVPAPEWSAIARYYAPPVRAAMDALVAIPALPPPGHGRLLLVHGPPGTGKTTLLRSLARAWHPWARAGLVADHALLGEQDTAARLVAPALDEPARLIIVEDADELIAQDASRRAGAGVLARLLNLTDGMLGSAARAIVVVTTNEPIAALHPAVVRAGRCLAEIEVGPLPPVEVARLLPTGTSIPVGGMLLVDVLERLGVLRRIHAADGLPPHGQYL